MYTLPFASRALVNVALASCSILIIELRSGTCSLQSRARIWQVRSCDRASVRDRDVVYACIAESVIKARNSISEHDDDDNDDDDDDDSVGGNGGSNDDENATEKLFDAVTPRLALTPEL